ncbi:MAG TPA: two-component regulator propeller domain-containing protein, partial [Saprospiraceae bacterium]|nr:two-component regulator propeller domain-containing protein [Saprospiraceae bacterium]
MLLRTLLSIPFGLILVSSLVAQPSNTSFLHYTTDQGLSNDYITSITKDKLGFLWVSTANGLNRFDGRSFKSFHYDPKNPNSLPDDNILGISLGPDGWIWIGTTGGLCKLNPTSLEIRRLPIPENSDSLQNDEMTQVAFDSKGKAWTTGDHGIYRFDPKTDRLEYFYPTPGKTPGWHGMLIDPLDRLWLIKDSLVRFDPANQ